MLVQPKMEDVFCRETVATEIFFFYFLFLTLSGYLHASYLSAKKPGWRFDLGAGPGKILWPVHSSPPTTSNDKIALQKWLQSASEIRLVK